MNVEKQWSVQGKMPQFEILSFSIDFAVIQLLRIFGL
jgi:hypothetical protein